MCRSHFLNKPFNIKIFNLLCKNINPKQTYDTMTRISLYPCYTPTMITSLYGRQV